MTLEFPKFRLCLNAKVQNIIRNLTFKFLASLIKTNFVLKVPVMMWVNNIETLLSIVFKYIMEASNPPAQEPIITQILERLEILQKQNKALNAQVATLKQTVEELKASSANSAPRPLNRNQTAAGHLAKVTKEPTSVENPKGKDRVQSTITRTKKDDKKDEHEPAKDDKKDQPKKKDPPTKVTPPPRVHTAKKVEEEKKQDDGPKRDSRTHTRVTDHKTPTTGATHEPHPVPTPTINKKDTKKANDKAPPKAAQKQPKKIMGGAKKESKKQDPPAGLVNAEIKLDKGEGDKHVEIEKLEVPELTETTDAQVAAEPAAKQEELLLGTTEENHEGPPAVPVPPEEHHPEPEHKSDPPAAQPPAVENPAPVQPTQES